MLNGRLNFIWFAFPYPQITGEQLSDMYKDFIANYPGKNEIC